VRPELPPAPSHAPPMRPTTAPCPRVTAECLRQLKGPALAARGSGLSAPRRIAAPAAAAAGTCSWSASSWWACTCRCGCAGGCCGTCAACRPPRWPPASAATWATREPWRCACASSTPASPSSAPTRPQVRWGGRGGGRAQQRGAALPAGKQAVSLRTPLAGRGRAGCGLHQRRAIPLHLISTAPPRCPPAPLTPPRPFCQPAPPPPPTPRPPPRRRPGGRRAAPQRRLPRHLQEGRVPG
jgi:hypothetical protein